MKITFLVFIMVFGSIPILWAQEAKSGLVELSDSVGTVIDKTEKETFGLFPDIKGFDSAQFFRISDSKYRLSYTYRDAAGLHTKSNKISSQTLELTRLHVKMTEKYQKVKKLKSINPDLEADFLYQLALKYASQTKYKIASTLFSDLISDYPNSVYAQDLKGSQKNINRMWKTKKALFWKGSLQDKSGRNEIMIFSGYYGLWLGIATPLALKADSPQLFALGLILGGRRSMITTNQFTKDSDISDGRATIICLGGHWGTWQGIGWAVVAEMEGNEVVGIGELGGLLGIGAATLISNNYDFSTGHAGLTNSGLHWGAWSGLVLGNIFHSDDLVRDMLIGSNVFILGTALTTKNVQMSNTRIRLINLSGVVGAVLGFGIDMFAEVDDISTAMAIAGLGSVAGAILGKNLTKDFDKGKDLTSLNRRQSLSTYATGRTKKSWKLSPYLTMKRYPYHSKNIIPCIGIQISS